MPQVNQQILGLGGGGDSPEQTRTLLAHAFSLTGRGRPRVLHVPTAVGDADSGVVAFYERCTGLGELAHLKFHPWPPAGLRELVLAQDAIFVGGGSTANMLAIWRVHGFDEILREAWEAGDVVRLLECVEPEDLVALAPHVEGAWVHASTLPSRFRTSARVGAGSSKTSLHV